MSARNMWTAVVVLLMAASFASAVDLQAALKMAQCRAHCLDKVWKYSVEVIKRHKQ